jgi:F-type H+-transporting ATPase subunit epsilon
MITQAPSADSNLPPLNLSVLTPSKKILEVRCFDVNFPSSSGRLGILPNHEELFCNLSSGVVHYLLGNFEGFLSIAGGFAHVKDNTILLLADSAELPESIDLERAQKSLNRAQTRLSSASLNGEVDSERALVAQAKAQARIQAAKLVPSNLTQKH